MEAAASILAIAGAGIQISLKLIAFADQVSTAPKRIQDVGTDVSVTAGTLMELGELMKTKVPTKKLVAMFRPDQIQNIQASSTKCQAIFDDLKHILGKASQQLRDLYKPTTKSQDPSPKIKLSRLERMKWPFLQPQMEALRSELRDAKGTLGLILQVVHLRHAQTTASLDRKEQKDLVRMIAAMRRQQISSAYGGGAGSKGLDATEGEDSDSGDSSRVRMDLEAWSVTPNTSSGGLFEHFLITRIPLSQQQIAEALKTSPHSLREIASLVDRLSSPERDAILGEILGSNGRTFRSDVSTIRSISSQSWTGSHDLFGKVTGRKFKLIVERRTGTSTSSRSNIRNRSPAVIHTYDHHGHETCHHPGHEMHSEDSYAHDSNSPTYYSFSDSDEIHETEACTHESSPPPAFRKHARRRPAQASPHRSPCFEKRRPFSGRERKQDVHTKRREEQGARKQETGQSWTEPHFANELSDDDLVKILLAQYTSFEPGEPLVQTPPPTYDETFVLPSRDRRPY